MEKGLMNFFKDLSNTLWGNFGFQAMFFLGLIIIAVLEQEKWKRNVFVWYPALVLLVIYNPITVYICIWIFGIETMHIFTAYYSRLFSAIPIVFMIAYSLTLLINKLRGWNKLLLTLLSIGVIAINGNSVYQEQWFIKASNYNKVPNDILQICEMFLESEDEQIRIMTPPDLAVYLRQMNSAFSMPYGRGGSRGISDQLESETPNVSAVIQYAVSRDVEYIVCSRSDATLTAFTDLGCEVAGYTDNYAVIYNFPSWKLTQYADATGSQAMFYTAKSMSDGTFIVIDGGVAGNSEYLREVINENGGVVDAWILTHFHEDHIGAFNAVYADLQGIIVKKVYDIPTDDYYHSVLKEWDNVETFNCYISITRNADNVIHITRDDTVSFDGLIFTFYNTYDDLTVKYGAGDVPNNASLVFKLETKQDSILFCADCHDTSIANMLLTRYGDELCAEYVQTGHHGNNSFPAYFYDAVKPQYALFDAPEWLMTGENYNAKDLAAYFEEKGVLVYDYRSAPNEFWLY